MRLVDPIVTVFTLVCAYAAGAGEGVLAWYAFAFSVAGGVWLMLRPMPGTRLGDDVVLERDTFDDGDTYGGGYDPEFSAQLVRDVARAIDSNVAAHVEQAQELEKIEPLVLVPRYLEIPRRADKSEQLALSRIMPWSCTHCGATPFSGPSCTGTLEDHLKACYVYRRATGAL